MKSFEKQTKKLYKSLETKDERDFFKRIWIRLEYGRLQEQMKDTEQRVTEGLKENFVSKKMIDRVVPKYNKDACINLARSRYYDTLGDMYIEE